MRKIVGGKRNFLLAPEQTAKSSLFVIVTDKAMSQKSRKSFKMMADTRFVILPLLLA